MAEFKEVMRQKTRMCKAHILETGDCRKCGLNSQQTGTGEACVDFMERNLTKAEKIIMDWAAKHQEPQYPTWEEWYESTFPNRSSRGVICPRTFMKHECAGVECGDCYKEHIPADIAEKLHISPVERSDNKL